MRLAIWIASLVLAISGANGLGAAAVERSTDSPSKHPITFSSDVAPILYANCVSCHRPGEVAPFPLISFEQVKKHAHQIVDVTGSRTMPPWKADAGAEMFLDARRLNDAQIQTLSQWVSQGMPEGNPHDLPALPKFTPGWQLGEPDVVLAPSAEYHVDAEGDDVYRCFVLKTDYPQDRYLSGMEIRPGNRKVVHHVMGYVDARHDARKLDGADGQVGYSAFGGIGFAPAGTLEGWGPGIQPRMLPDGVGMFLPAGSDIVIQVHYHKSGKPETDLTRIGLHFARKSVDRRLNMAVALNPTLRIPPGAKHEEVRAYLEIPEDISLIRIAPHMHLLGREMSILAELPNGTSEKLVAVPDWDFRWQTIFTFRQPVKLPKGTRINVIAHYDNSASNPNNPSSPPREVRWGEQTTDEMCVAALFYTVDAEHLTQGKAMPAFSAPPGSGGRAGGANNLANRRMALQMFDKNHDGHLDEAEINDALEFLERLRGPMNDRQRAGTRRFLESLNHDPPTTQAAR